MSERSRVEAPLWYTKSPNTEPSCSGPRTRVRGNAAMRSLPSRTVMLSPVSHSSTPIRSGSQVPMWGVNVCRRSAKTAVRIARQQGWMYPRAASAPETARPCCNGARRVSSQPGAIGKASTSSATTNSVRLMRNARSIAGP